MALEELRNKKDERPGEGIEPEGISRKEVEEKA